MAKFSFDDADEDPPAAAGGDKRKRGDSPTDAFDGAGPPKARNLGGGGREREVEGAAGCGAEADGGISVRIDPDVLDCSICFEPLRPPLYQIARILDCTPMALGRRHSGRAQVMLALGAAALECVQDLDREYIKERGECQNGHVACFSCWSRLCNKCHICSHDANFARNIALEKIVESVKSSCSYSKWGCCKLVNYAQRTTHEETCLFAPSLCPIPGCGYRGFTGRWSGHFLTRHSSDGQRFVYGQPFQVKCEASVPFLVLLGEDDHLFLLLNNNMTPFGHAFSVVCLRTGDLNWKFSYKIKATSICNPENRLQLKACVTNTKQWGGLYPVEAFLLVPYGFCNSSNLSLTVSIERYAAV
ncbi:hypothetical protein ACP70R_018025 [Stipagrostis hirtigluma subsp. patula]